MYYNDGVREEVLEPYSHIAGNLWVGGCPEVIAPRQFRSIFSLYVWGDYEVSKDQRHFVWEMHDSYEVDEELVHHVADKVEEHLPEGPTLVHCQAGLNRSGLIAGLVLVRQGMTPEDAIHRLRHRRSQRVLSNPVFEFWLLRRNPSNMRGAKRIRREELRV